MSLGTTQAETMRPAGAEVDERWLTPGRFAFGLALLIAATFPGVLLKGQSFVIRDFGLFGYPLAYYHRECFWKGDLPLWNPLSHCGMPYLAQWNTLTLYPGSLLYLLLPMPWSVSFFCLAHLFLGGLGMYFLAERWTNHRLAAALAGIIFSFNGLALNFMMWPNVAASFAWMPWVLLLAPAAWREGGRKLIWATLAGTMQMLSGSPEVILLTWVLLLALWGADAVRREGPRGTLLLRFCAMACLIAMVCAAQLLPFLELLPRSQREAGFGGSAWSMPLWGWANFLVPLFHASPTAQGVFFQDGQYWTSSYYMGIGTVLLAAVAAFRTRNWRVGLLLFIAGFALLLALGDAGLLYRALHSAIPGFGFMRFPVKFVVLVGALAPLLAALGLASLACKTRRIGAFEWLTATSILAAAGGILFLNARLPLDSHIRQETFYNGLARCGFLIALFALTAIYLRSRETRRVLMGCLLLIVFWLDLATHVPPQNPTVPGSVYAPGGAKAPQSWTSPPQLGRSRAMLAPSALEELKFKTLPGLSETYLLDRLALLANCNLLDGVPQVHGFFSMLPGESSDITALPYVKTNRDLTPLFDFMGVSQITAPGKTFDWSARPSAMPLVTAGQQPVFADDRNAFEALSQTNLDLRQVVLLPLEARGSVTAARQTDARVLSTTFENQKVTIQAESPSPFLLTLAQSYYPAWKAYVDGQPVKLWRANYAFQTLQVPPGRHTVRLAYQDKALQVGLALSGSGIIACLAILLLSRSPHSLAARPIAHGADCQTTQRP